MIIDAQNRFSDAQDLFTPAAGTIVSTNVIDLLSANRNIGRGYPKRIQALVGTAFAGGTSVQAQVIQSANSNMSSPDVLASGTAVVTASLTAGAEILDVPVPDVTKRYLAVQYITVGDFTAGTVTTNLVEITDHQPYVPSVTGY
jgi:hypothetical protein